MKLLTTQKNEIYDIIEKHQFSPSQFIIVEQPSGIENIELSTIVKYSKTDYFFSFVGNLSSGLQSASIFSPGKTSVIEHLTAMSWTYHITHFIYWLQYLNREVTAPNKWERLQNEMKQIGVTFDNSIDKFSAEEYEELKQQMYQVKAGIKTIGLQPEQITLLNAKIDHLTEMALKMNKFDWKSLFTGTIVNLSMTLALSPESRTAFWELIKLVLLPIIQLP